MRDIELAARRVLLTGVVLSFLLFVTGIIVLLAQHGAPGVDLTSSGLPLVLNTKTYSMAMALAQPSGITLIYVGLVALVLTPVSIVSLLLFEFARQRNGLYTAIAAVVLVDMLIAIVLVPAII